MQTFRPTYLFTELDHRQQVHCASAAPVVTDRQTRTDAQNHRQHGSIVIILFRLYADRGIKISMHCIWLSFVYLFDNKICITTGTIQIMEVFL